VLVVPTWMTTGRRTPAVGAYVVAILFIYSRTIKDAVYPYAVALKSTPLIAIAPLLVLWLGNGLLSKMDSTRGLGQWKTVPGFEHPAAGGMP
jgi:NitT/TauT family transport system permease protein